MNTLNISLDDFLSDFTQEVDQVLNAPAPAPATPANKKDKSIYDLFIFVNNTLIDSKDIEKYKFIDKLLRDKKIYIDLNVKNVNCINLQFEYNEIIISNNEYEGRSKVNLKKYTHKGASKYHSNTHEPIVRKTEKVILWDQLLSVSLCSYNDYTHDKSNFINLYQVKLDKNIEKSDQVIAKIVNQKVHFSGRLSSNFTYQNIDFSVRLKNCNVELLANNCLICPIAKYAVSENITTKWHFKNYGVMIDSDLHGISTYKIKQSLISKDYQGLETFVKKSPHFKSVNIYTNKKGQKECRLESYGLSFVLFTEIPEDNKRLDLAHIPIELYQANLEQYVTTEKSNIEKKINVYLTQGYSYQKDEKTLGIKSLQQLEKDIKNLKDTKEKVRNELRKELLTLLLKDKNSSNLTKKDIVDLYCSMLGNVLGKGGIKYSLRLELIKMLGIWSYYQKRNTTLNNLKHLVFMQDVLNIYLNDIYEQIFNSISYDEYCSMLVNNKSYSWLIDYTSSTREQKAILESKRHQLENTIPHLLLKYEDERDIITDRINQLKNSLENLEKVNFTVPINHLLNTLKNKAIQDNLSILVSNDQEIAMIGQNKAIKVIAKTNEKVTKTLSPKKLRDKIKFNLKLLTQDEGKIGINHTYRLIGEIEDQEMLILHILDNINIKTGLPELLSYESKDYYKVNNLYLNKLGLRIIVTPRGN
jgi:hypothetical protein